MTLTAPPHFFTQSAVIPYRIRLRTRTLEICLITSRKGTSWIIPKGVVEPKMTPPASALKEAWEEAGIKGRVVGGEIGSYTYEKWGGVCTVSIYPMRVKTVLRHWPESYRERRWLPLEEAIAKIRDKQVRPYMESLPSLIRQSI